MNGGPHNEMFGFPCSTSQSGGRPQDISAREYDIQEEGIVPGGGVALLRAAIALQNVKLEGDEQFGVTIVRRACEEPVRQIVLNSGIEGAIVVEKIRSNKDANFGYNASTDQYED